MKPPAFQFYPSDFLVGTAGMTNEEVGMYIRLLAFQWERGGLPADDRSLRALLNSRRVLPDLVRTKFELCEDGLMRNARMEAERKKQAEFRESRAENARKRWNAPKSTSNARASSVHMQKGMQNDALQSSSSYNTPVVPKGTLQLRAEKLFNRRVETPLTDAERRAFRKNKAAIEATSEAQWQALERFYAAPQEETFSRKDLATLVNNWNGEIDRALKWNPARRPNGRADLPTTIISAKDDLPAA